MGQKQTLQGVRVMSALPPKADIVEHDHHVRFVPIGDIRVDPKEKLPDLARGFVVGTLSRLPVELIVQPDAHDVSVK